MRELLVQKLVEVLKAVAPLVAAVSLLQLLVVQAPLGLFLQFIAGSLLAAAGMVLLFVGIDYGILPMGRFLGAALPLRGSLVLIAVVAAALGFATTLAEPDVLVLAEQVAEASRGKAGGVALATFIAAGVGALTALGCARIVWGVPFGAVLGAAYALAIVLALAAPPDAVAVAFDAGSVTTGVLSAPVVLALALGLTSVLSRRSGTDAFGVLGLASIGPVLLLLLLGVVRA